ncbi:MAG TPA: hypothetical protein DEP38_26615 [Cyanobacteria bacterium UBA9226]|nr:hypothetical protein [Cyanobacteria bacterium UBA11153]HCA98045.1 hypothetical protein [Cyanobacteria bacterium UBA9226]
MTQKLSSVALLSIATVASATLLTGVNSAEAFPSPFKSKGILDNATGETSSLVSQKTKWQKMGIATASIATLAGLTAAGVAFKANRIKASFRVFAHNPQYCGSATFPVSVSPEILTSSVTSQKADARDLTSVG